MASHSIYNSQDNNCLVAFITMVNPSDVLAAMISFDNDKQPIVARWIWVLWSHLIWEKGFKSFVDLALDTKSPVYREN